MIVNCTVCGKVFDVHIALVEYSMVFDTDVPCPDCIARDREAKNAEQIVALAERLAHLPRAN